jgi:hypothetical protein
VGDELLVPHHFRWECFLHLIMRAFLIADVKEIIKLIKIVHLDAAALIL